MLVRFFALTAALCLPTVLHAQSDASIQKAIASITPADVAQRIGLLADDSMRGRSTPSPELDLTAQYIAGEFQRLGLTPAGDDGTYLQRYPLEMWGFETSTPVLTIADGPSLSLGRDAVRRSAIATDAPVEGPVTLLWGTVAKPADVAAFDLAGSVVFWIPETKDGELTRASLITEAGLRTRAAALVVLKRTDATVWARELSAERQGMPRPAGGPISTMRMGVPVLAIQAASVADALAQHGVDIGALADQADGAAQARSVDGMTASVFVQRVRLPDTSAPNVVGILEGSDPDLKDEFVVFSAHMDHAGTTAGPPYCAPKTDHPDDDICNGADDNASGTAGVVELAEAFAELQPRPKRSMLFLTVSGEERGLWGSAYYGDHPTVPMEQIVADINVDMIGRNWTDTIAVIGKEHSDLGATLDRVNAKHPELDMEAIDDIWPEENFYSRSDHYNFARKGVPILFFFNGTHDDYHAVTDEPEKIDAEKESRIVKLLLYLGIEIANTPQRPQWNPESYEKVVS